MNREYDVHAVEADTSAPGPADAESELQFNRGILRQRLVESREQSGTLASLVALAEFAAPLARRMVRKHPYSSLTGAALAGAWLAQYRPWRALGGSLLAGALAREAVTLSLSSGRQWLEKRNAEPPEPGDSRTL